LAHKKGKFAQKKGKLAHENPCFSSNLPLFCTNLPLFDEKKGFFSASQSNLWKGLVTGKVLFFVKNSWVKEFDGFRQASIKRKTVKDCWLARGNSNSK
jgi:hypothetical protein